MFPNLLIELELYAIVIGLSIATFIFLARERMRKMKKNGGARGGRPLGEDKDSVANPFVRVGHTF